MDTRHTITPQNLHKDELLRSAPAHEALHLHIHNNNLTTQFNAWYWLSSSINRQWQWALLAVRLLSMSQRVCDESCGTPQQSTNVRHILKMCVWLISCHTWTTADHVNSVSSRSSSLPSAWFATLRKTLLITSLRDSRAPMSNRFIQRWNRGLLLVPTTVRYTVVHMFCDCVC